MVLGQFLVISRTLAVYFLHLLQKYSVFSFYLRNFIFLLLHSFPVGFDMFQSRGFRWLHCFHELPVWCYVLEAIKYFKVLFSNC